MPLRPGGGQRRGWRCGGPGDDLCPVSTQGVPAVVELDVPTDLDTEVAEIAFEDGSVPARRDARLQLIAADVSHRMKLAIDAGDLALPVDQHGRVRCDRPAWTLLGQVKRQQDVAMVPAGEGTYGVADLTLQRHGTIVGRATECESAHGQLHPPGRAPPRSCQTMAGL